MNNLPRQKLREIITIYGRDICKEHKRLKGLLNDLCSGNYPEINFLLTALEERIDTELLTSEKMVSYELLSARLAKRLYTNRGIADEVAHWAVDSWALALGVIAHEKPYVMPQAIPNNYHATPVNGSIAVSMSTTMRRTVVVSPSGGHYSSISEAIKNAAPNATILVKPGHYEERLIINKRVEIKGDGPREQIIIESSNASCLQMQTAEEAIVQGLTLRCYASRSGLKKHAVDIPMGRLRLLECDITSDTLACIFITGLSTYPTIQKCWLHDAGASGLFIENHAQGSIEDCYIFGNQYPNISIRHYANPTIRRCKIYNGGNHGVLIWQQGAGTIEDCDIFENARDGVKVVGGGTVRGCRIYRNSQQEEWVYQNNMGNSPYPKTEQFPRTSSRQGFSAPYQANHNVEKAVVQSEPIYSPQPIYYEMARQSETIRQPERKWGILNFILHSIGLGRKE